MILRDNNGLAAMIERETQGATRVYLDGDTVSVHLYDANRAQIDRLKILIADYIDRLKILIADYIDRHMLMGSYAQINIYS